MPLQLLKISPRDIPQLSPRDRDYWLGEDKLQKLLPHKAEEDAFRQILTLRKNYPTERKLLHSVLSKQYSGHHLAKAEEKNLRDLLSENTFTVCTAHQPVLFTGPLYFIYKIASAIALARRWEEKMPEGHRIVPVFILGAEDHDFEEIACAHPGEHDICWHTQAGGPVGRLSTQTLEAPLQELEKALNGHPIARRIGEIFRSHKQYGPAMAQLLRELFGKYGLLVLQTDEAELKRSFIPQFKKELFERPSREAVESAQQHLQQLGYRPQAHAREINLFYMSDESRRLILPEGKGFRIRHTDLHFTEEEMLRELEEHPERFSPNVVMRPLFQEHILPNLAYVGGGGELAYWMERPAQFERFGIPFPMLVRRNSALWLSPNDVRLMEKTGITPEELFLPPEQVLNQRLHREGGSALNLSEEKKQMEALFRQIERKAEAIDPTLLAAARARARSAEKELEKLEKKMLKAEKRKHEQALMQLQKLHNSLFPSGKLQERHANFLPYYAAYGPEVLDFMVSNFDPLERAFYLLLPDESAAS